MKTVLLIILFGGLLNGALTSDCCVWAVNGEDHLEEAKGSLDFKDCVRLALEQSPRFTQSALEIDIRGLDESDSRWSLIPYLYLHTSYAMIRSDQSNGDNRDFAISFSSGAYNPLKSYFSMKAREIMTQIAMLNHQKIIEKGIHALAKKLLELEAINRVIACRERIVEIVKSKLTFVKELHNMGSGTFLDVQTVFQQLAHARAEIEKMDISRMSVRAGLNDLLGLDPYQKLNLNLPEGKRQVLKDFNPDGVTLKQVKSHSFVLKIVELKKQLQKYNITRAYARYVPNLNFGVITPGLTESDSEEEYVISLGASYPIWDGLNRSRNISRQKRVLKKYEAEMTLKERALRTRWQDAMRKLRESEMNLKLARSNEELAKIREYQSEIRYEANTEQLSNLLDRRREHIEAQINTLWKIRDRDMSLLNIRNLSGDLFSSFVNVISQKGQ